MNNLSKAFVVCGLIVLFVWLFAWARNSGRILLVGKGRKPLVFLSNQSKPMFYFAHWKYGISAAINTGASYKCNKDKSRPQREVLIGSDGGEFAIDWFQTKDKTDLPENAPIVIFSHGINGGSSEPPLQRFALRCVRKLGWRAVCVIFRSCCGTTITTPTTYYAGYTDDLHIALKEIQSRYPDAPIALVGYSMGGNVVAKYLGERKSQFIQSRKPAHLLSGEPIPPNVLCAAAICCPFNLKAVDHLVHPRHLTPVGSRMFHLLQKQGKIVTESPRYKEFLQQPFRTSTAVDHYFTIHTFGFPDTDTMYDESSSCHYLDGIEVPMLFISTKNDPASIYKAFPKKEIEAAGDNVAAIVSPGGAHLGMFGVFDTKWTFDEEMLVKYLQFWFDRWENKCVEKDEMKVRQHAHAN
eukprot:MONOS_3167.1-p1 / transcript=MONOS_3167.1 / gene=MONOS_3167 / organism=Monocercomonoides_exilis_PA203 / gene_product=AB-hydrolase YheT / transcript_product=AB-hydrolase YheT / location=Mono_scaffold00072:75918-77147(+) / protein_length=409 / sequence_SO=supercontig / SO=protein_coding / is_pseudo=false